VANQGQQLVFRADARQAMRPRGNAKGVEALERHVFLD